MHIYYSGIEMAKRDGARLRLGSELEISGYGCADHFLEPDTVNHSWEMVAEMLLNKSKLFDDIITIIGMPIIYKSTNYNCLLIICNG